MADGLDLSTLSLEQLSQLKQQEEQKLSQIQGHYTSLKATQARFINSQSTLTSLPPKKATAMIPLTQSLYVSAVVNPQSKKPHDQTVLVELGTGFYANKTIRDAHQFMQRKIELTAKNADSLFQVVGATRRNIDAIIMTMQGKMNERAAEA
mmetsp:Transcript_29301/g.58477  ORF Transcript_29301/g.58477 Transcript_29301/m.58477 type:complete len:151 (+) Transcript_29301:96-548(+)